MLKERQNLQTLPVTQQVDSQIYKNSSSPNLKQSLLPLQNLTKNGEYINIKNEIRGNFKDFDEERRKRFDHYIEGGYDGGQSFFRAQD
jgi:hypothetical protein